MSFGVILLVVILLVIASVIVFVMRRKKVVVKVAEPVAPPKDTLAPASEPAKITPPSPQRKTPTVISNRVLVIEDDQVMLTAVKRILEREGHIVTVAKDGKEGFDELDKGTFDTVIIDLMLPFANGLEIVSSITANAVKRDMGIIVCSTVRHEDTLKEVFRMGADYFINKPINAEELISRIQDLSIKRLENPKLVIRKTKMGS